MRLGTLLLIGGFIALVTLVTLYAYARLVSERSPYELVAQPGLVVVGSNRNMLRRDMSDGLRVPVKLQGVSPAMIEVTIAAEDARLRGHPASMARNDRWGGWRARSIEGPMRSGGGAGGRDKQIRSP